MRLDALQLLCDHHKTTSAVSVNHLSLVKFFLQFNMDSQSPAFRQMLVAQIKKVCNDESASVDNRGRFRTDAGKS